MCCVYLNMQQLEDLNTVIDKEELAETHSSLHRYKSTCQQYQ